MNTTALRSMDISDSIGRLLAIAQSDISEVFSKTDEIAEFNQYKVLGAFQALNIGPRHFAPTTGYGYSDEGRDALDLLFAKTFGCARALVRPQFVSGTHALASCLFALLGAGDTLVCATGRPYDTILECIGVTGEREDSLTRQGVAYVEVPLADGAIDEAAVSKAVQACPDGRRALVLFQRSRGYSMRPSMSAAYLNAVIQRLKGAHANIVTMVDNCYGEFMETVEPVQADVFAGSLIKNPGGGLAPTGGYVAGSERCVEAVSHRLTAPGLGGEVGSYAASYLPFFQGFFLAPSVVANARKAAALCARAFERLGYGVHPDSLAPRYDIIQAICLRTPKALQAFCRGIQQAAAIDARALPLPWDMPGYEDQVIMAAGTFIQGASIELSADAPLRPPYVVYFQGGLTFAHAKLGVAKAIQALLEDGILSEQQIEQSYV